jgi:hypothetical protein
VFDLYDLSVYDIQLHSTALVYIFIYAYYITALVYIFIYAYYITALVYIFIYAYYIILDKNFTFLVSR